MHSHLYALGQQISYAEDGIAWPWKGGFEVIALLPASGEEPAYRIRNAEQAYDRLVCEHELSEPPTDKLGPHGPAAHIPTLRTKDTLATRGSGSRSR